MINIPVKLLKAITLALPTERASDPNLCRLHVELAGTKITLVASDGKRVHAGTFNVPESVGDTSFSIPAKDVAAGLQGVGRLSELPLCLSTNKLGLHEFRPENWPYPAWRTVVPTMKHPGKMPNMMGRLLREGVTAFELIGGKNVDVDIFSDEMTRQVAVLSEKVPELLVVTMGNYEKLKTFSQPDWV